MKIQASATSVIVLGLLTLSGCGGGDTLRPGAQPQATPSPPPPLTEVATPKSLPTTSPVAGQVTAEQRGRRGDYVDPAVCSAPEIAAAAAAVLGAAPSASRGGFLTDVAGETAWALEYAGAASERAPTTDGEGYPSEARLLCWYDGVVVLSQEDRQTLGGSAAKAYRSAVVSIAVDAAGKPTNSTPIAIFRSPNRLPVVAPAMSSVRTGLNAKSRPAAAKDVER